jgi:ArsR family transcriptional regulator
MNINMTDTSISVNMFPMESSTRDVGLTQTELCCEPLSSGALSEDDAAELASILKALADPVRLRVVSIIAASESGEVCTCDLPELLDRSQPTVSHHLTQLVKAGIVEREQRGKWAWFRLRPQRLNALGLFLNTEQR